MRVIKVGGRPQQDPALIGALAAAWEASAGALVVIHGGGDEVSALQRAFGAEPRFLGGRRVTSAADVELLRMALSGSANKRLVSRLSHTGVPAVGLSGEDGGLLVARPVNPDRMGFVGAVHQVNVALLRHLLGGRLLPIVSPLAQDAVRANDAAPGALNVNGDDAAAAVAVALRAEELVFLADVPGVLVDGAPVGTATDAEARDLIRDGVAQGGMAAKLEAALTALAGGVDRVRITDIAALHDRSGGTVISLAAPVPDRRRERSLA